MLCAQLLLSLAAKSITTNHGVRSLMCKSLTESGWTQTRSLFQAILHVYAPNYNQDHCNGRKRGTSFGQPPKTHESGETHETRDAKEAKLFLVSVNAYVDVERKHSDYVADVHGLFQKLTPRLRSERSASNELHQVLDCEDCGEECFNDKPCRFL
mmetsp:Transcript_126455/g.200546  ORF Transcript_126455/g.200546 Transcript_126455/m.200546 type:complete len:155 (+) Transcript_126455:10-474(+)